MSMLAVALFVGLVPQGRFPAMPDQDARHYDIDLRVDLEGRRLSGHVDYTFTAVEPLASIRLDALRSDRWSVTFRDAEGRELEGVWGDDHVVLKLPEPASKGTDVHFRAELAGTPVDGFYFKQNRYGEWMAFTDHYSIRARGWLPCEDHPSDRARFTVRVDCPEDQQLVGYGLPVGDEERAGGRRTVRLAGAAEIPPYMFAMVIGPLARVPEPGDPRIVDHFVYGRDVDKAKQALVHHAAWIAAMEGAFGAYPYGKYTTVQCPTRWGGFEAPGNVQLAEGLFDVPARGMGTLAHELVHMWFGDAVGYSEWREVWLSEGFASYFGPWLHARTGGPALRESMRGLRERWAKSFEGRTKSIRDDRFAHPDQALNSNTYPKGAWVLHMLRAEVGEEKFFAALRAYVDRCRGRSVMTDDFVTAVEESTGIELSWFFDQWLDRIGCPELKVSAGDGEVVIEQVQKGEPYTFWLRLRWQDGDGEPVERRVRVDRAEVRVAVPGSVAGLEVDPDVELLFRRAR